MTCSEADAECPFVPGAQARIPLRYNDPSEFDNTPQEMEGYLSRSKEIATELKYAFENVK